MFEASIRLRNGFPAIAQFEVWPPDPSSGYPGGIENLALYTTRGKPLTFIKLTLDEEADLKTDLYFNSEYWET